jgi:hypothetical protein
LNIAWFCRPKPLLCDWQVAVNHLYAATDDPDDALWFSSPDIVASKILTGTIPNIVDAFRIESDGVLPDLQAIKLRGMVEVEPSNRDFFRTVIEERKRLSSRVDLPEIERKRLDKALKVLANAASYGIYAEMNRQESDEKVNVICRSIDAEPYARRVSHPDIPGEFCFPPLATKGRPTKFFLDKFLCLTTYFLDFAPPDGVDPRHRLFSFPLSETQGHLKNS